LSQRAPVKRKLSGNAACVCIQEQVSQDIQWKQYLRSAGAAMDPEALRAMLIAQHRAKIAPPSAGQTATLPAPVAAEEEAARKRDADAIDAPSSKRARTVSESEAAADALLQEMAAEQPLEEAPTDDEALQGALHADQRQAASQELRMVLRSKSLQGCCFAVDS